ncbi:hypothetical protein GEMRC1_001812 [Eukaryota sp. GEM-RC1]
MVENAECIEDFVTALRTHSSLTNVIYSPNPPASHVDIDRWQTLNAPYTLPSDFKSFCLATNGFDLSYDIKSQDETIPLGKASICALSELSRIRALDYNDTSAIDLAVPPPFPHAKALSRRALAGAAAFVLTQDFRHIGGRFCFFYREGCVDSPEIWLQDLALEWWYVCSSFSDLMRLFFYHFCLPRWALIFTDTLPDQAALHWLRLLAPKRLELDLSYKRSLNVPSLGKVVDKSSLSVTPKLDTSRLLSLLEGETKNERVESKQRVRS